jgi:protein-S-isoprenylcysteine O-methyltransferase Ste14
VTAEAPFKFAFMMAFLGAALVATAAARRATRRHGGTLNQLPHEVRGLVALRAMLGLLFYGALGVWLLGVERFAWSRLPLPDAVRWTAVALLVPALVFFERSFRELGTNYRGGVGLYDEHELVTAGPYAVMRHPIYAGFAFLMLLVTLISADWVIGLSGLTLVLTIAAARIPIEERELRGRFTDRWDAYRIRTRAFGGFR